MKVNEQLKRSKEVLTRNQQRCLNSQPFSRQRAYLSKQKCQKNMINLKQLEPCLRSTDNNGWDQKFSTQQLMGLTSNVDEFDSNKIQRQMSEVQNMMDKIQMHKDFRTSYAKHKLHSNPNRSNKVKTSQSTRTDSMNSPNSIDLRRYWNKGKFKTEENDQILVVNTHLENNEGRHRSSFVKDMKNKMVKVKSSRNVLKVYNPFPSPMAEML